MSAPTLVQYADAKAFSVSFDSNVTEGDFLVCIGAVSQPTDSLGNDWIFFQYGIVFDFEYVVWVCPASKASGANTVSTSSGNTWLAVAELSPSVIQAQSGAGTGGTSPSFAGAVNELLVGLCSAPISGTAITGVGSGFIQASGSYESEISLEYQDLVASGNISSDFSITGIASRIGTSGFTLSATPTPLAGTPSIVQIGREGFTNHVTKGNSILIVAFHITTTNTPALTCSDSLGNAYVRLSSSAVSGFGVGSTDYCFATFFFCAASKASGVCTVNVSGPSISIPETWQVELSPCAVAAYSPMASGSITGVDIVSAPISASAGELLIAFGVTNDTTGGFIGMPCAGFAQPSNPSSLNSDWFVLATQPVVTNGEYNSDFNIFSTSGSFSGTYVTGVLALASVYSISGNAGLAGATVSWSGTSSGSTTADGSGNFTISGLIPGEYTITPSALGYVFSPTSANETVSSSNITGVNFTAALGYSVSGNTGIAGATVSYSGTSSGSVTADGSGNFSIPNLVNGSYTITPSLSGYSFSPASQAETVNGSNIAGVDFTPYIIEDWMWVTPFANQVDGVNDANLPMSYRVGFASLAKMQITYSIYLHNKGADSPTSKARIWNNPNPGWQQAMVGRQQQQTPGFATIYANSPLLPNPVPPIVIPFIP
jgi:hypothetical protein